MKGVITITVSEQVLAFAADNHPNFWNPETDKQNFKVTSIQGFACDVVNALNDEGEDGSCPVSRMLDAAIEHALEQGSVNVDYDDNSSSETDGPLCAFAGCIKPAMENSSHCKEHYDDYGEPSDMETGEKHGG